MQPNQKKEDGEAEAVYDFDTEDPGLYDSSLHSYEILYKLLRNNLHMFWFPENLNSLHS